MRKKRARTGGKPRAALRLNGAIGTACEGRFKMIQRFFFSRGYQVVKMMSYDIWILIRILDLITCIEILLSIPNPLSGAVRFSRPVVIRSLQVMPTTPGQLWVRGRLNGAEVWRHAWHRGETRCGIGELVLGRCLRMTRWKEDKRKSWDHDTPLYQVEHFSIMIILHMNMALLIRLWEECFDWVLSPRVTRSLLLKHKTIWRRTIERTTGGPQTSLYSHVQRHF